MIPYGIIPDPKGIRYAVRWLEQNPGNPRKPFQRGVVSALIVPGAYRRTVMGDFLANVQRNLGRRGVFKRWVKLKAYDRRRT